MSQLYSTYKITIATHSSVHIIRLQIALFLPHMIYPPCLDMFYKIQHRPPTGHYFQLSLDTDGVSTLVWSDAISLQILVIMITVSHAASKYA